MKLLFSSPEQTKVGLLQGILDEAGIASETRNMYADFPGAAFFPELWVLNDGDFDQAAQLRDSVTAPQASGPESGEKREMKSSRTLAMLLVLFLLLIGIGTVWSFYSRRQSYGAGIAAMLKEAGSGDPQAQFEIGLMYATGRGIRKNEVKALKWIRKAAEQHYAPAQYELAIDYLEGEGVVKDDGESVKWFRKAAEQNDAAAQTALGHLYLKGQGVAKDAVEGTKWYRKAAEMNFAAAQYSLGYRYHEGLGVTKDEVEATKWFRKAAEQNDASAQRELGYSFIIGQGVEKDEIQAAEWYRKAAEQNHSGAQYDLGLCYAEGEGVGKDFVQAYKWFLLAATQGKANASARLKEMEGEMTTGQIAEAKHRALAFREYESSHALARKP